MGIASWLKSAFSKEEAVRNQDDSHLNLEYTKDVMDIMSQLRKEWKMQYPGEKW